MTMRVESYSYRDPANTRYGSTHTIIVESTGGTPYTIRHAAPASFLAVLAEWASAATTATGEAITIAWSATTDRVTIANAAGVFEVTLPGSVPEWLGFATSSLTGAASYTGTLGPRGIIEPINVDLDALEHVEQSELHEYRLGRAAATTWHAIARRTVEVVVAGAADQLRLCGWLTSGRLLVTDATGVQMDGFVASEESHELQAQDGSILVRRMVLTSPGDPAETYSSYGGLWGAIRYGWSTMYWLQIAGVDTLFCERASDIALPAGGYIEEGSLVIDDSAEVGSVIDRQSGIGAGLSLSAKLLDTDTVRNLFARPTAATWLTATLTAAGTSCTLEDGSVFDSGGGTVHIGMERLTYASIAANTMSGLTRATAGSLAYEHRTGFIGQAVTDKILWWRGRPVLLWAAPLDPMGRVTGASLDAESVQVWKGRMEADPQRVTDGFELQCQSLDRVITESMPDAPTGTVIGSGDYAICPGPLKAITRLTGYDDTATLQWGPYQISATLLTEYAAGELLTQDQVIASLQAAWSAAVTAAGATGELELFLDLTTGGNPAGGYLRPNAIFKANSATYIEIELSSIYGAAGLDYDLIGPGGGATIPDGWRLDLFWPLVNLVPWSPGLPLTNGNKSVSVQLDDSVAADIPASGRLRIKWENLARSYTYSSTSTDGNVAIFGGLIPADPTTPPIGVVTDLQGCTVEVTSLLSESSPAVALSTILQSSGTGLRGAYDTESYGYGIPEEDMEADGDWSDLAPLAPAGDYDLADQSAESMVCGLLALRQAALVLRLGDDQVTQQLRIVSTIPSGSDYAVTLTDGDLLGYDDTPVASVDRLTAPNVIVVQRRNGSDDNEKITVQQLQSIQQQGRREVSWDIVASDRDALVQTVLDWAPSWQQQDGTGQAIELRVPPWIDAHQGDLIWLDGLTHPALWQWGSRESGYTGPARVTGRTMELVTTAVVLTLLIDGSYQQHSLSPAMQVSAFAGTAGAPTTITVPGIYLKHLQSALALAATIELIHYIPAQAEAAGEGYVISAVAESGADAVLTVQSVIGTPTLRTTAPYSWLTLPLTADCTDYQAGFAHDSDGSYWI